jgi:ABC-type molybdate transport system substrate-binding protein
MRSFLTIISASASVLFAAQNEIHAVTVFTAASLTDSLKQIAADYENSSGDKIIFNFAASATLSRQIEAGAPADIFCAADETKADAPKISYPLARLRDAPPAQAARKFTACLDSNAATTVLKQFGFIVLTSPSAR